MIKSLAFSIVVGATLVTPPVPPIDPSPGIFFAVDWFDVPSGSLPWTVPSFPAPETDLGLEVPDDTMDAVEHTAGYATQIADMEARYTAIQTPIATAIDLADDWIGGVELPDMTYGDFDTELNPTGSGSMYLSDFTTDLTENIALVYQYIRLLTSIDIGGTIYAVGFIMICVAWMFLLNFVKFGIQIADMIYSLVVSIIELIPVAE